MVPVPNNREKCKERRSTAPLKRNMHNEFASIDVIVERALPFLQTVAIGIVARIFGWKVLHHTNVDASVLAR